MERKNWEKAATQLREWHREGKNIPYYKHGNFLPWLAKMYNGDDYTDVTDRSFFHKKHDKLYQNIYGPYGWTIIQVLIIQYRERLNVKWKIINEQFKENN